MFLYAEYFSLMNTFTGKLASFCQGFAMLLLPFMLLEWSFCVKLTEAVGVDYLFAVGLGFLSCHCNSAPASVTSPSRIFVLL